MRRTRYLTGAIAAGLLIGAVSTGFVIAQLFTYHGYSGRYQAQYQYSPKNYSNSMPGMGSQGSGPGSGGSAGTFSDPTLAHFIAEKAGTRLEGQAPQTVPASQVKVLSQQVPAGATIDRAARTITFTGNSVAFTVVAIAPGQPDMTFAVAGLPNPTIVVPTGAKVTVHYINNDQNEAHGWLVTANQAPFGFGEPADPAISGAAAGVIGDPTSAGDGADTFSFTASTAGHYNYICPMPGHAQMGMHGAFIVG